MGPKAGGVLAIGAAIAVSLLMALAMSTLPTASDRYLAVFPPWWPPGRTLDAAARAGDLAAVGAAPFLVVLQSGRPGLAARLHDAGAWLLLDPSLAGICATPQPNPSPRQSP
ncbi:MAG: hypothetical protein JSR98_20010 [Proteobacteria bacterium]|nr:hypothetical protein [Pseudomonadota bacterium]